jgi:hypothetical protein
MSQLRRHLELIDGVPVGYASIEAAVTFYASINMRLVSQTNDCIEFAARVIEAPAPRMDELPIKFAEMQPQPRPKASSVREWNEVAEKPKRSYVRSRVCAKCGAERDPKVKMSLCRPCYQAYCKDRYNDERIGALKREENLKRYHRKKGKAA